MGKTNIFKKGYTLPQSAIDKLTVLAKKSRMSKSFALETLIEFNELEDLSQLYQNDSSEPVYSRKYLSSEKREAMKKFHKLKAQPSKPPELTDFQKEEAFALDPDKHPEFNSFKETTVEELAIKKIQQQLRKVFKNDK